MFLKFLDLNAGSACLNVDAPLLLKRAQTVVGCGGESSVFAWWLCLLHSQQIAAAAAKHLYLLTTLTKTTLKSFTIPNQQRSSVAFTSSYSIYLSLSFKKLSLSIYLGYGKTTLYILM